MLSDCKVQKKRPCIFVPLDQKLIDGKRELRGATWREVLHAGIEALTIQNKKRSLSDGKR
jgi:hypothetical protein